MFWLKSNVWEIQRSRLLSYLGAILAGIHAVNYFHWLNRSQILNPSHNSTLLCWDFSKHCGPIFSLPPQIFAGLLTAYLAVSCFAALGFITRRLTGMAWVLLFIANAIKLFYYLSDASLAVDIQALLIFINFGFLFVPSKANLVRYSLLFYYFIEGYRELTPDWLTGKELQGHLPLPIKGLEWAAAGSIVIKWTLPLLLVSPFAQRLAFGVLGLLAYHLLHLYFFSDFESVAMTAFVIYLAIEYFERRRVERESLYQSYALPEPSHFWWPVFLALFILAQVPQINKNSAFTLLKIEGPAAINDCVQVNFAHFDNRTEQLDIEAPATLKPQLKCLPNMAINAAKSKCADLKKQTGFKYLSSYFFTRGLTEGRMKNIFSEDNVCEGAP